MNKNKKIFKGLTSVLSAIYKSFIFGVFGLFKIKNSKTFLGGIIGGILFLPLRIKGYKLYFGRLVEGRTGKELIPDDLEKSANLEYFLYSSPNYYYSNNPPVECKKDPEFCIFEKEATVIGESNLVITTKGGIIFPFENKNQDARFLPTEAAVFGQNGDAVIVKYYPESKKIDQGISLLTNLGFNYYHFLIETITKFLYFSVTEIPANIPLLVDEVVLNVPQFKEILEYFNNEDREIIYVKKGKAVDVTHLYYLPCINFIPPNYKDAGTLKAADTYFNIESLKLVRNTMLAHSKQGKYPKRFFLTRSAKAKVRKYNEEEIIDIAIKYGLEAIDTARLSAAEQVALFSNAEFIVGATGASFTNLLFCQPNCKVLCISSYKADISVFSSLASFVGLDMQYYVPKECLGKTGYFQDDFSVDEEEFERVIKDYLYDKVINVQEY